MFNKFDEKNWVWNVESPLNTNKAPDGKEKKFRYSVYLSNGNEHTWGTPMHVYCFTDGNNVEEMLVKAYEKMLDLIAMRQAEVKTWGKNEVYYICYDVAYVAGLKPKYFAISKAKYEEKNLTDKIVKTISPER